MNRLVTKGVRKLTLSVEVVLLVYATAGVAAASVQPQSSHPKNGGTLQLGGSPLTVNDFTQSGFAGPGNFIQPAVFGSLFFNPLHHGGAFLPDLTTKYSFNKNSTQFTITLRAGLKFSDGTPLNATALAWNWSSLRDNSALAITEQYMTTVTSVTTKGKLTVVVRFSQPDAVWISDITTEPLGLMASPTALQSEGQNQFDLTPVGAGPFKITGDTAGQLITYAKNPLYWDAKHIYMAGITVSNTGTDPTVQYDDLQSGAIDASAFSATTSSPTVIAQAIANHNFNIETTPNLSTVLLPINTYAPPFNNQLREALDYCMDRNTIANSTFAGFATPAWTYGGPATDWYPTDKSGKPSVTAAEALFPYPFNQAKGEAIVQQLGGLTFSITAFAGERVVYATILQQAWTACGMHVSVISTSTSAYTGIITSGSYQVGVSTTGTQDPRVITTYLTPTASLDHFGFNDPTVNKLLTSSYATNNQSHLASDWRGIWKTMNADAVLIPVVSAATYNLTSKCVNNVQQNYGVSYLHSWLSC